MTREELKARAQWELDYDAKKGRYNSSCDVMEYIDIAYDYFESKTCTNCNHISTKCDIFKNNYKYILKTRGLEISKNRFTCGLWEIKERNEIM